MRVVLDERKPARRLGVAVEAHDDTLDPSAEGGRGYARKELVDLLLGRVEGQVAHVERGRGREGSLLLVPVLSRA